MLDTTALHVADASPSMRWRVLRRRYSRWVKRVDLYPRLEIIAAVLTIVLGWSSYALLTGQAAPANGVSPPLVTLLLVANLLPVMVLVVLIARRVAILLANRRNGLAGAQLHVRMVALFAGIAAVPTILVVIFASLLFQFGVQFWFSDRVKTVLDSSNQVAQAYVEENRQRVGDDITAMAGDIDSYAREFGLGTPTFAEGLERQKLGRNLTEAAVFKRVGDRGIAPVSASGISVTELADRLAVVDLGRASTSAATVVAKGSDRIEAIVGVANTPGLYIYVSRKADPAVLARADRAAGALDEYRSLVERSRTMQLRFNLVLMGVSLLTLAVAIWFALWLANRMVAPIARLAVAAERVGAGDLDARVPVRGSPDEIGTLARAFNRMTAQLKTQQQALIGANSQLDARRQFTEAVLSGVSAGVLSISPAGDIRVANRSAAALLQSSEDRLIGQPLRTAVPDLAVLLEQAQHSGDAAGQVRIVRGTETQTLSVRIAAETGTDGGYVLTFDDISAQLADQRRAAWADVARRIAHEIKNPLTPIQLAAERLQRKFGKQISEDADTFGVLTGTIVRQVGDLRRMVDEFSDFARLPKPIFGAESPERIAAQALVLQEVAFPAIVFTLEGTTVEPMVCDRQQIARALTNLIKNAAESVMARIARQTAAGETPAEGRIHILVADAADFVTITVTDNGIGLPAEGRDRLTEPYVTTRARGTGLGLAIVKKIVEDHGGTLELGDAPGEPGAFAAARFSRAMVADSIGSDGRMALRITA
ncbi:PAS domain-containing sensor histidine kinase [Polymorphobacter glacialis]|uniref:histidine kinase n=1 Tax=Sandarakinorhabdus glacialis TaxID=1614636 RepID=A0A916ZMF4_9SPHN|nr:PAS domain-containing sensor histidine kinase [Polymorphobacter glacialis]GGE04545.1 PAS domain-containing sensor histidine kinase [Polymorphobacter glacialis]